MSRRTQISNSQFTPDNAKSLISRAQPSFMKIIAATNSRMNFAQEGLYAYHAMMSNQTLYDTAAGNEVSFILAMQQIASSGLSLNPSLGLAYLVPRQGKVIADISYRGLMKIATDSRAVDLVVAEAVYAGDRFIYNGPTAEPDHVFDPFLAKADRGIFRGVYVKAYLPSGRLVVDPLSAEDVYAARQLSRAFQHSDPNKRGPWATHFESMAIKTGIKSASKYWPKTSPVLENVISYLNEEADEGFGSGPITMATAASDMLGHTVASNIVDLTGNVLEHEQAGTVEHRNDGLTGRHEMSDPLVIPTSQASSEGGRPQPASAGQGNASQAVHTDRGDPVAIMRKRIQTIYDRTIRNGSWNAATQWAKENLRDELQAEALALFKRGEALSQQSQKASA